MSFLIVGGLILLPLAVVVWCLAMASGSIRNDDAAKVFKKRRR